jgi:hypothetical protein
VLFLFLSTHLGYLSDAFSLKSKQLVLSFHVFRTAVTNSFSLTLLKDVFVECQELSLGLWLSGRMLI